MLLLFSAAIAAEVPRPRPAAAGEAGAQEAPQPRPQEGGLPALPSARPGADGSSDTAPDAAPDTAPDTADERQDGVEEPEELPLRPSLSAGDDGDAGEAGPEEEAFEEGDDALPSLPEPKDEAARRKAAEAARRIAEKKAEEAARRAKETAAAFRSCAASLRALGAKFSEEKLIDGEGGCFVPHPLSVERLLPEIAIRPAATLNCATSLALARWLKEVVEPAAAELLQGARPSGFTHASAYVCRHRYGNPNRKISEHAFANALDLSAITFEDRAPVRVKHREVPGEESGEESADKESADKASDGEESGQATEDAAPQEEGADAGSGDADAAEEADASADDGAEADDAAEEDAPDRDALSQEEREALFQRRIREGACRYFTTVLGPGTNSGHATHFHFDLAKRSNGYRICQ